MTKRSCHWWCRLFLAGVVGVSLLASCGLVEPGVNEGESGMSAESAMSVVRQEGAPVPADVEYVEELESISRPWRIGFGNAKLVLERPLGRGWLLIRGAPR